MEYEVRSSAEREREGQSELAVDGRKETLVVREKR
jgi:hypothetical protein